RVHKLLSGRLEGVFKMFGQIPDILEDVWIEVAMGHKEKAQQIIDSVPEKHPFEMKYDKIEDVDWESYTKVLNNIERKLILKEAW
ncbi:MAG: helicase, partial [Bacteroidales bacterium]|nr:helicase [Bacteroidales bacterium]